LPYPAVDFLNARPYLGYETNFNKRHGVFWVRREEDSMRNPNDVSILLCANSSIN